MKTLNFGRRPDRAQVHLHIAVGDEQLPLLTLGCSLPVDDDGPTLFA
jgi:hypothetical protein